MFARAVIPAVDDAAAAAAATFGAAAAVTLGTALEDPATAAVVPGPPLFRRLKKRN